MCVLMVCFNVLELLLDEKAMPMGMEVSIPERIGKQCPSNDQSRQPL